MATASEQPGEAVVGRRSVLTTADHEHFIRNGFVIVKNVVKPDVLASAVASLDEWEQKQGKGDGFTGAPIPSQATACITEKMHDAIADLFGETYPHDRGRYANNMPRSYQPEAEWSVPIAHIDDDYPTLMPNAWAVGTFLFLTPVRSHGGAFIHFAGSANRYRQAMHRWPNLIKAMACDVAYSGAFAEFLAQPGDLLLFHHLCGHSGSNNVTDPRMRHALLSRWHPRRRIVPGTKPFEQMTTIEKANSSRYHREVLGFELDSLVCPKGLAAATVLREGWLEGDGMVTQTIVHHDGRAHLLFIDAGSPAVVRHRTSHDLVNWIPSRDIEPGVGGIEAINLWQQVHQSHLVVAGRQEGSCIASVMSHRDLSQWQVVEQIPGYHAGQTFRANKGYASRIVWGYTLFLVDEGEPSRIECRWQGADKPVQPQSVDFSQVVSVWQAPQGCVVRDLVVHPTLGEQHYAFVFDMAASRGDGASLPHYIRTRETCRLETPAMPLIYTTPTPPRCIRPYMRAFNYWLVTYLRQSEGRDRLFFGAIDWAREPVQIVELSTPEAMDEAFATVGFV